ncbi:hypothetical protein C8A03DRAFT_42048 [Achaetomium macrosporum]|uniref:2EXR domain-containing protein n=1 Tax=Achaetomium macrosporum TaxID=79813 RepID=A0AAN7CF33_9PEZI|nr:hypothetical protein C8A03DRAFT_42048 [Achaetomium macrosporum]
MERSEHETTGLNKGTTEDTLVPRLYNDVYFNRAAGSAACDSFAPFPRLPTELRLLVWLFFLRRQRMIRLAIRAAPEWDEFWQSDTSTTESSDQHQSRYYTGRNHLGSPISGREYWLHIDPHGHAASLSPLLWVNREARREALGFYRIHLPYSVSAWRDSERVLYLNPEYDVLSFFDWLPNRQRLPDRDAVVAVLVDFLHDIRAYDRKGQGATHIALRFDDAWPAYAPTLSPAKLHLIAAASFAEILGTRLRSVLYHVRIRTPCRFQGGVNGEKHHFAQTRPLMSVSGFTRGAPLGVGDFRWFDTDPRWGVEYDIGSLTLRDDPIASFRGWKAMERAFGIAQREADDELRFYICPYQVFAEFSFSDLPMEGSWREHLADYLRREEEMWLESRGTSISRHGSLVDAETFCRMESVPRTAIGMWICPLEAFRSCKSPNGAWGRVYDLSRHRPGLLLFEV